MYPPDELSLLVTVFLLSIRRPSSPITPESATGTPESFGKSQTSILRAFYAVVSKFSASP